NQDSAFYQGMWENLLRTGHWRGEIWNKKKNGEVFAEILSIGVVRNAHGELTNFIGAFADITPLKKTQQHLETLANFDPLTQLPNRRLFNDRLAHEIKKAHRSGKLIALMFIDLDNFKEINDTLGHDIGDRLLEEAARRITGCLREYDTVARLGGDEFGAILPDLEHPLHAERIAQSIIDQLIAPFQLDNDQAYISASIGITLYPTDADNAAALMKNADQAMYLSKNRGRNRYSYFTAELQEAAQQRMRLLADLRNALKLNQFSVHYQPIVELTTGRIRKAEALLRWTHPELGTVGPAQFIPVAEESGLIVEIGDWVYRQAAQQAADWRARLDPTFQISINRSPVQFRRLNIQHKSWLNDLQTLGLSGDSVVIEITEGLLLNAEADIRNELIAFREAGVEVAIDDFGTGYSSLAYLQKFDIDYLKIDRAFVSNLHNSAADLALVEAIIVMAHTIGLKVIAEGVETEEQHAILKAAGCDYAQGYLFSRPVPPEAFERMLHAHD
ncbi:MAG: EAL domain-containing protein, partial [Pseudomonadota bacterium]